MSMYAAPGMDRSAATIPPSLTWRLSLMMFLQYAIWGAWLPILFPFLLGHRGFSMAQTGGIFAAGAAGAILGPFIAGQIADRHFATQKFLAASHFAGAILVWFLATIDQYTPFLVVSVFYGIIYAPTLALTNSLAFHHLTDRDRQFGPIRLWGTIGWIAVGIAVGQWLLHAHSPAAAEGEALTAAWNAGRADAFRLSAVLGVIMAVYCMTLPHTPPAADAAQRNATLEALGEIRRRPLIILFLLAIPVSMIHQFYFVYTSDFLSGLQAGSARADAFADAIGRILGVGGGGLMTIGQMSEIAVLALIPILAKHLSRKQLLAVGLAAYALRMAIFAFVPSIGPVLLGVALHGFCFGCFIFVAFMVVDEETTPDVRATAQNLFNMVIVGIGIAIGSMVATRIGAWATVPRLDDAGAPILGENGAVQTTLDYVRLFSFPMWASIACLVLLGLFYPGGKRDPGAPAPQR
ncbi:MAG: MFS transporter [Phycisphaeraceae bacterium]|nr:MFS transporter [Phycisphaeraceae bacterium]